MAVYTKDEIYQEIVKAMAELFELDPAEITPGSRLVEDLDLDSIDAVDMIVRLQNMIGKRIKPEDFKSVRTVGDVVDVLVGLQEDDGKQ